MIGHGAFIPQSACSKSDGPNPPRCRGPTRRSESERAAVATLADSALAQKAERPEVKVGDRWQFAVYYTVASAQPNRTWEIASVTPTAIVNVPAGEFDAFKLTAKGNLHGISPINSRYAGVIITTYWYAPAARAIVKSVTHNPYLGVTTVELVGLQLRH